MVTLKTDKHAHSYLNEKKQLTNGRLLHYPNTLLFCVQLKTWVDSFRGRRSSLYGYPASMKTNTKPHPYLTEKNGKGYDSNLNCPDDIPKAQTELCDDHQTNSCYISVSPLGAGMLFQISSHKTMWDWIRDVLIPGIYEDSKDVALSNSTPYIGDGDAVLVGMPRLRQLRVKKGATTYLLKMIQTIERYCSSRLLNFYNGVKTSHIQLLDLLKCSNDITKIIYVPI